MCKLISLGQFYARIAPHETGYRGTAVCPKGQLCTDQSICVKERGVQKRNRALSTTSYTLKVEVL